MNLSQDRKKAQAFSYYGQFGRASDGVITLQVDDNVYYQKGFASNDGYLSGKTDCNLLLRQPGSSPGLTTHLKASGGTVDA